MSGFDVRLPRRLLVDEVITTGTAQKTGVTGWTGQGAIPRYNSWANPLPPSSSVLVCFFFASSSAATTVTVFSSSAGAPQVLGQPDYPRAVRVTPSTSAFLAANSSVSVTVTGTNQFGAAATDIISMGNGTGPIDGVIAFKTITSVVLPATSSAQTPFTIGLSNNFGLDRICASAAAALHSAVNGTIETTWPIIGAASSSGNTSPSFALNTPSRGTAKFNTAATSSAGALVEIFFVPQDTTQGHI